MLDARWGIAQGFDNYFDQFDLSEDVGPGLDAIQRPGGEVVDAALEWLGQPAEQPFFGWVHLYDPHTPYDAPAEFRTRFPATRDGAYDAEVAYTDSQVGRLIEALRAGGRLDDTLVVVLGNHGEQLGEHRELSHGFFVYDASVQIPLVMAGPGISARVVRDQVRIIDVMPTVLDLLGVPSAGGRAGGLAPAITPGRPVRSCWPSRRAGTRATTTAGASCRRYADGAYKFILAPTRELYDLGKDPGELSNLAGGKSGPGQSGWSGLCGRWWRRPRALKPPEGPRGGGPGRRATPARPRLRGVDIGAPTSRIGRVRDPKDRSSVFDLMGDAYDAAQQDHLDDAIATMHQALADEPGMVEGVRPAGQLARQGAAARRVACGLPEGADAQSRQLSRHDQPGLTSTARGQSPRPRSRATRAPCSSIAKQPADPLPARRHTAPGPGRADDARATLRQAGRHEPPIGAVLLKPG